MGKAFILWLLGVPFTLLLALWFFGCSDKSTARMAIAGNIGNY